MKAKKIDLELYTDSAFHELFKVISGGLPQDFTDWQFKMVFADSFFSTALFEAVITTDEPGILLAHVDPAVLEALLPAAANEFTRNMTYVLKAKPGVSYPVRLFYGAATLNRGLPLWS